MTQRKGRSGVLPEREKHDSTVTNQTPSPISSVDLQRDTKAPIITTHASSRRWVWGVVLAIVGVIVLAIVAALTTPDTQQRDAAPQTRGDAGTSTVNGSDQHLGNQAARARAETSTIDSSDRHHLNQAARTNADATTTNGSDQHLTNQAARAAQGAE